MSASRGFTLVELIVVIVVIGLLAGLSFPIVNSIREQSRRVQCLSNQKTIWERVARIGLDPQDSFHPSLPYGHLVGKSDPPNRPPVYRKDGWLNDSINIISLDKNSRRLLLSIPNLTLGDFKTVYNKLSCAGSGQRPQGIIEALAREVLYRGGNTQKIGFNE